MNGLAIFNFGEATFWIIVGAIVFGKSRLHIQHRNLGRITAIWFVLFGVSDIGEAFSGAWYRPWPLLAFKAICVVALVTCGIIYRNATTQEH